MAFRGYKLKAKLYAAHSNVKGNTADVHFHTFTFVLYLNDLDQNIDYFRDVEKNIESWLAPYQKQVLAGTPLFAGESTTLEAIGDVFYTEWVKKAEELKFDLVRLDVYENPVRTYSVSNRLLDSDVNEISAMPYCFRDTIAMEEPEPPELAWKEAAAAVTEPEEEKETFAEQEQEPKQEKEKPVSSLAIFGAVCLFCLIAAAIVFFLQLGGKYPQGADTFCHLYRADLVLKAIKNGNFYPLYDEMWYNGVEIMRYWAPLPLYLLALLEAVAGSMLGGYLLFAGVVFLVGSLGWLLFGIRLKRVGLATAMAIVWFFLPETIRVMMSDGNLPRAVIHMLLPYLLYATYRALEEKHRRSVLSVALCFALIGFCHIGTAIIILVTFLIFLAFYGKKNHCFAEVGQVILATLCGLLLTGIWMVPSLHGSGAGNEAGGNQVMKGFFVSVLETLNPVGRLEGDLVSFYYGILVFLVILFGVFFGTKKTLPGFATGLIIFLCTTESAYALFEKLPFSQYLWMIRFAAGSLAFVLMSMLLWRGLRRWVMVLLCGLLLLDCLPSYQYVYTAKENRSANVSEYWEERAEELGLAAAKAATTQRLAVFDLSTYGAFAPYYVAGVGEKVAYTYGAGWEGARTADNIVMLNTALETGYYSYLFDRCISMGTDTVLIVKGKLQNGAGDVGKVIEAGARLGYEPVKETENTLLLHKEVPESFGVCTDYKNLAIGFAAKEIAFLFPSFEEGSSQVLDEYSAEELKQYERIFLSDFTYQDKEAAEALLVEAAEAGVRIYIDMNKVPVNSRTNLQELFGVTVQSILFQDSFPVISYEGGQFATRGFPEELTEWRANYLVGLTEVTGTSQLNGVDLAFSGTAGIENITFLGYNFAYYAEVTGDERATDLLEQLFDLSSAELPERKLLPIEITTEADRIIIESAYEDVNTTLANIDIFHSEQEYKVENNLIVVGRGTTVITMQYPYFASGLAVSVLGLAGLLVLWILLQRTEKRKTAKTAVQ